MMGSARVGKSSIISQFLYDKYLSRYRQTVEELHRGEYELDDGSALTLDILDTSGAYQFPAMRALSISTGGAFLLVFAVDEEESWKEVERLRNQVSVGGWLQRAQSYLSIVLRLDFAHCISVLFIVLLMVLLNCSLLFIAQIIEARGHRVAIVIVANKADVEERKFPREITETIATVDWECGYVECSAKDNVGIVDVFKELLAQAKIRYNLSPAVRRRRQSLPSYSTNHQQQQHKMQQTAKSVMKRHSCTVA